MPELNGAPELSVVVPVFNEGPILRELVSRCASAAEGTGLSYELVFVDDASADATPELAAELGADPRVRFVRLSENQGQFRATVAGLRASRGTIVAALDGDLQDPPELLPELVAAWRRAPSPSRAAFARKPSRGGLARVFHAVQSALSDRPAPPGIGSYCVMSRALADRVAGTLWRSANLGSVCASFAGDAAYVEYAKAPRWDGASHVGALGLAAEALGSWAATGALRRLLGFGAAAAAAAFLAARLLRP